MIPVAISTNLKKMIVARSFSKGATDRQVCYVRGIAWLQASLLFLCAVLARDLLVYHRLKTIRT